MEEREIHADKVYVLHGYWDTPDFDGVKIIKISHELEPVEKRLEKIAENKAADYLELHGYLQEDKGRRYYEVTNGCGKYAKFYITEEVIDCEE